MAFIFTQTVALQPSSFRKAFSIEQQSLYHHVPLQLVYDPTKEYGLKKSANL
jgi:hypothetical protein